MIDTHCHLTYTPILSQFDAVMARAKEAGVQRMVTIGTAPADAKAAAELAQKHEPIFFACGLHPHYAAQWPDQAKLVEALQLISTLPKHVAMGEMGLDRHYNEPTIEVQRRAFAWQLGLVAEINRPDMPVIIHSRETIADSIPMMRDSGVAPSRFVFHCFTGSDADLDNILEFGSMVSFTGIVTFKNSTALADSAKRVPLDRLMIETDAPYLTPAPFRKVKVNEPFYVQHTAKFLAEQRGLSEAEFVKAVDANAERFFGFDRAKR